MTLMAFKATMEWYLWWYDTVKLLLNIWVLSDWVKLNNSRKWNCLCLALRMHHPVTWMHQPCSVPVIFLSMQLTFLLYMDCIYAFICLCPIKIMHHCTCIYPFWYPSCPVGKCTFQSLSYSGNARTHARLHPLTTAAFFSKPSGSFVPGQLYVLAACFTPSLVL